MKKIIQFTSIVFILLFMIAATACDLDAKEEDSVNSSSAYLGSAFNVSDEQVYTRNGKATKISQVYLEYKTSGNYDIIAYTSSSAPSGSGKIENGILNFNISQIEEADLMDWEEFKTVFRQWDNVTYSTAIKCAMFLLYAYDGTNHIGILDRQRITGTSSTITQETLMYIYVDNNCTITGEKSSGYEKKNFYYFTEFDLNLPLKKGWNIVSRTETYGVNFSGSAHIDMKIINPIEKPGNYKWVMEQGFNL